MKSRECERVQNIHRSSQCCGQGGEALPSNGRMLQLGWLGSSSDLFAFFSLHPLIDTFSLFSAGIQKSLKVIYAYVCILWMCVSMCAGADRGQKKGLGSVELEL